MKKLPLVLALSAASLCTLASAQSVTVYGRLYPYIESESGSGASAVGTPVSTLSAAATGVNGVGKIKGMSAGNSNIGLRGKEDLGDGLRAEFQLEGVVAVDTGGTAFIWNRNTFVGLEGKFGEVRLGLMDTVFKEYGDTIGILGTSSGTPMSSSNVLRKPGFGTSSASRFHERRANSMRYDSPEMGGVQAGLQVATQELRIAGSGTPITWSMGLKYDNGPIYLALAYERHDNFFGGSANVPAAQRNNNATDAVTSKDTAIQGTVEWRITKQHKLEFDVIRKNYDENAIATNRFHTYQNNAFMLAADSRWSTEWRTAVQIVKSQAGKCTRINATCTTTGLEGSKFTAGVAYYLSKRTFLYGVYDQITNGASARFSNNDFGTPNAGEDTRHLIAGISHGF
jgi:predicted porin